MSGARFHPGLLAAVLTAACGGAPSAPTAPAARHTGDLRLEARRAGDRIVFRLVNDSPQAVKLLLDYGTQDPDDLGLSPFHVSIDGEPLGVASSGRFFVRVLAPGEAHELESHEYTFGSGHALTAVYATNDYLAATDRTKLLVEQLCPDCWIGERHAPPIILDGQQP